ncbi:MAG TPA: hypothetical protein HA348_07900 [Thermoplasmata archaeon]|nr:hypothetical protein [Thermoplasmata archaeon]
MSKAAPRARVRGMFAGCGRHSSTPLTVSTDANEVAIRSTPNITHSII